MIDTNPQTFGLDDHRRPNFFDIAAIDPIIRPLIPYFVELTTERIAALKAAVESGAFDQIKRLAHTIKGSAASYGFPQFADIAARIEQDIAQPHATSQIGGLIDRLAIMHLELRHTIETSPELFQEEPEDEIAGN